MAAMTQRSDTSRADAAPTHTIYTVGHSSRTLDELVAILQVHGVSAIADVRRFPGSRKWPHFNQAALQADLPRHGIQYLPFPGLGGRRKAAADSPNSGWRNQRFRG
jgi:uncharacterized protein (DUF488 family)